MPDAKISDLPAGGDPQDTDEFVVARGATNVSLAWSSLSNAATRNNVAVTLDGNTAGALALVSTGTLTLAGGNNITLSQAGNAVTISGGAGGAETQTAISGISASDTLYTSGTVRFTGSQAVTVRSGTGQLVVIDAPAQSVQPETQTFVGGISASDTLYTSGTVRFTGVGGGVTVSSNTGQRVDISVAAPVAQSVQTQNLHNVTLSGNTAGVLAEISSGTMTIAGGNNITVSQAGNAITISGANVGGAQTGISGIANSETTYTSGTVSLSELGAITIRSTTGNQFQFSVNAQSVQPETQTFIAGISASDTLYTSGNVRFTGVGGGITVSSNTGQRVDLSVAAPVAATNLSVGVSTGGNTLGDTGVATGSRFVIVGSNGITASQGTAAGATTVTLSGVTQSVQTQDVLSVGVSTGGNTAGDTTVNTGSRFVIVGSNGITASQGTAAGATTVTLSGALQTTQTQGIINAGVSTGGNTSGDTGVNSGTRLVLAGGNNITLSQGTAAGATTVTISAGAGGGFSGGMSTNGNTSGDTGYASQRLNLVGGNNITLSGSTDAGSMTITVSAPNLGAGAFSGGASTGGNTAGATGITGTQLVFVGTNMISLSQTTGANGGTLSINATQSVQTQGVPNMGVSTGGATSGDTGVNSGTRFVLVGTHVTLSQGTAANATTVTVSAPATSSLSATGGIQISTNGSTISIGDGGRTAAYWENMPAMEGVLYTHISGVSKTPFYWPEVLPAGIKPANIALRVSMVTANSDLSLSVHFGVYTFVNSTSVALLGSASDAFHVSSASSVSFSAQRNLVLTSPGTVAAISSLSAGNYLFGVMFSASATNAMNASIYAASAAAGPRLGRIMPGTNQVSTATSQGIAGLYGRGSTTVNAMPANVVAADLVNQGIGASSPMKPYVFIRS